MGTALLLPYLIITNIPHTPIPHDVFLLYIILVSLSYKAVFVNAPSKSEIKYY